MQSLLLRNLIDGVGMERTGFVVKRGRFPEIFRTPGAIKIVFNDHAALLR
jgi:hypothetical protein